MTSEPAAAAPGRRRTAAAHALAVAGLLVLHTALLLSAVRQEFVTVDETGHIPSGLAHWQTGSFAPYRVNPPLPRLVAALPVLLAQPDTNYELPADVPGTRAEWPLGKQFAARNAARYFDLVCLARLPGLGWSLLGAFFVYRWARKLYGPPAGLLSLALWCLEPNILAHAGLVTADIPATATGLAASYLFWRYLRQPSWGRAWFAGLALGLALLCKLTLLVLCGVWPVLACVYWWRQGSARRWARAGQLGLLAALGLLVVNSGYGFASSGRRLGEFTFVSNLFTGGAGEDNRCRGTWLEDLIVPVPADYLLGMDTQRRDFESRWPFYLRGEWRPGGWWYFYPYALAVKLALATLALVLGGLVLLAFPRPGGRAWRDELCVLLPAVALLALVSSQGAIQYFRYALPLLPFLFIRAGAWAAVARRGHPAICAMVAGLVVWTGLSSCCVQPHFLSYFNEVAGGPAGGPVCLVDSNVDWGQDLLFLKTWLDGHPEARPLGLAYFNFFDPRLAGIAYHLPPPLPNDWRRLSPGLWAELGPRPGWYAVSVHLARGGPFLVPDGKGRWVMSPLGAYRYFLRFRPVARAGYSIHVFRITRAQADAARHDLGLPELPHDTD